MNCKNVNIWLNQATPEELKNPGEARKEHMANCSSCSKDYQYLVQTFQTIDEQKNKTLSDKQTEDIVNLLKNNGTKALSISMFRLSKFAAAVVILLGLTAGFLAGILFSVDSRSDSTDNWSTEFSMLSDNEDYLNSIFD